MKLSSGRRRSRLGVLISVTALAVPGLAACSFTSPMTTATTYQAADGSNAAITDAATGASVDLRNFLVVGTAKGSPATLVGAVVNQGTSPVEVNFTVLDGQSTVGSGKVTAEPGKLVQVGPSGTAVTLSSLPAAPGSVLQLKAETGAGGATLPLPVLAAEGYYASITPKAAESSAPATTESSSSESSSSTESPSPTS